MKQVVVIICCALVSVAAVGSTSAAGKKPAWTESKAERFVQSRATVRLAPEDRAALEEELGQAVELYWLLALEATLAGDGSGANIYVDLAHRYGRALVKVRGGLAIATADCNGSGVPATGARFSTFRCSVTSELLEIPSADLADTPEVLPSTHVEAGGWSGSVSPDSGIPLSAGMPEAGIPHILGDGERLVEGQPRIVGPIEAELDVRVTGSSSFAYREV